MEVTKSCSRGHRHGPCVGSPYSYKAVPLSLFRKDPNDPTSKVYKTCFHCRAYATATENKHRDKARQDKVEATEGKRDFIYCPSKSHTDAVCSKYPRDQVPIELFRKVPDDPRSELHDTCVDCRSHTNRTKSTSRHTIKTRAEANGLAFCRNCKLPKQPIEMANGSSLCFSCVKYVRARELKIREIRRIVKLEFMQKQQSSCFSCNMLFFKPDPGSLVVKQTETFIGYDGNRYVSTEKGDCKVVDILTFCSEELEFSVLEFDHLPEEEQRARGLLLPTDRYIPKTQNVANCYSESSIRLEAQKCQLVCTKCHILETMQREKRGRIKNRGGKDKIDYVKSFKLAGCSSCGYSNGNLLRFFDLDHLDPANKTADVSRMARKSDYTLEEVVKECAKCRVLCKFCHAVRSSLQRSGVDL